MNEGYRGSSIEAFQEKNKMPKKGPGHPLAGDEDTKHQRKRVTNPSGPTDEGEKKPLSEKQKNQGTPKQ